MQTSQVYDLLPSRRKSDLSSYFSRISQEERDKVKYICMDMFQLYKDVVEVYFPCAKICIDSQYVTPRVMIDKMLSWSFELNAAYSMKEEYAYGDNHILVNGTRHCIFKVHYYYCKNDKIQITTMKSLLMMN